MIFNDGSEVKLGGVMLPGLFKSIEIKSDAIIDEQAVEGSPIKAKQAVGYNDAKINIKLVLYDDLRETRYDKLAMIRRFYKKGSQTKPLVYDIVNRHTTECGIAKVILKNVSSAEDNKDDSIAVTLELWEHANVVVVATKATAPPLAKVKIAPRSTGAPKIKSKTIKSPAKDKAPNAYYSGGIYKMMM